MTVGPEDLWGDARELADPAVRRRTRSLNEQLDRYSEETLLGFGSEDWLETYRRETEANPEQRLFTLAMITEVPSGGAPDHIREQWVGSVLLTVQNEVQEYDVANISEPDELEYRYEGFRVPLVFAISTLRNDGKLEAAEWWQSYGDAQPGGVSEVQLVFRTDCAEPVAPESL